MTAGTKAETVTEVIEKTAIKQRNLIKEITLDTAGNTNLIAWKYFRNAIRVIDRFRINPKTCGVVKFMHTD